KAIGGLRNKTFAVVVNDNRHIFARKPHPGFKLDPVGRHVGGKQRMAGGKGGLVPHIEQRDFFAQQQRAADLRGGDGWSNHGMRSARGVRLAWPVTAAAEYSWSLQVS